MPVFARSPLAFERGEGCWLITETGDRYLDFGSGVAVNSLGHSHPRLVEALKAQAEKLWHVSNLYASPQGEAFARRLCEASFADVVFFCNSGAEALEAAIKTARKHFHANGQPERYRLITFEGAFHGRTLATIAAGGQAKYLEGFGPKVEGFDQVPFGDLKAVEEAIGPETAGVLVEPLQGEGGVRSVPPATLRRLREICDEHGLLLVMDEVQTGVGRTGKLFAHELSGVTPDVMAVAKGIGGGFPMGACLATFEAADGMTAGVHGSTFGGNALAMAVGETVLDVVLEPGFLDHVARMGLLLRQKLASVIDTHPELVSEVRGEGLLTGVRCKVPNAEVVAAARDQGLLTVPAGDNVVRLIPPLIVSEEEIAEAVERLDRGLSAIEAAKRSAAE
ncbi:aspartate aminotransferase family protein [Methylopila sp. M107]|uniref:aspartate aminotransferase family protein n=1 Tax=Methylopila sp. M107 TaxID=1101190 RepID=UPI00036B7B15|nr:aspartate aminotransferase family protein [Methylopila sp. M107]